MADNLIFKQSWLDLIFKDKNKAYGAYFLRQLYEKNVVISVVSAATIFILAIAAPVISKKLFPDVEEEVEVKMRPKVAVLDMPPPADEKTPPPPPEIVPPKVEITKFLPPVPKPDDQVIEEIKTIEELKDDNIGNIDQEGDKNLMMDAFEKVETVEEKAVEIVQEEYDLYSIEEYPTFPGGGPEMNKFVNKNLVFPPMAIKMGLSGKVQVSFSVDVDGTLYNIKIAKSQGPVLDDEALKVVKAMPKWNPGLMSGKPVKVRSMVIPIRFELQE